MRFPAWIVMVLLLAPLAPLRADDALAREIYAELIAIDTTHSTGSTTVAAEAMARRLRAAGFSADAVEVIGPTANRGNLLARIKGSGSGRPLLLMAHIDVVEAAADEWTVPPFELSEADGYFYGRGTSDNKAMAAAFVANMIGYARSGWVPERDIALILTADEEGGDHNGVKWLLANRPELLNAEFAINEGGKGTMVQGRKLTLQLQFSEKVYQSYRIEAEGAGGHSALPGADNPINRVAAGVARVAAFRFPVNLSEGTREFFRREASLREGVMAADMLAILEEPIDPVAESRLAEIPELNGVMRTTCVATGIQGGHAENALPMRASATINCRVLPHEDVNAITRTLARVLADDQLTIIPLAEPTPSPPSPLGEDILGPVQSITAAMWPGVSVVPVMSLGATDSAFTRNAGIRTYGVSGTFVEEGDYRAHGKDERLPVASFYETREFLDRLVRAIASGANTP